MDDTSSPSPEERVAAAARAIRARREAEAADSAAASTRGRADPSARRTRRTVLIAAAGAAALLAATAVVWGVVQAQPPAPEATVAGPTATSTPLPTPTPVPTYTLVQVGEDLIANPPEDARSLELNVYPDALVAATALGEHAGWTARGMLSDAGTFCMSIHKPDEGGHGTCVPGDVFMDVGITVDRGSWEVTWLPDGTVTWTGI